MARRPELADPSVATCLWFDGDVEEAAQFYASLIPGGTWKVLNRHMNPDGSQGNPFVAEVVLAGHSYILLNGGPHFKLSPAASIMVHVDTQDEVDRLWSALLDGGGEESRCGWLADRFGVSWQILPRTLPRPLSQSDRAAAGRVMQAMMGMVKLDIAALEAASAETA
jgi:predicted 3-demethylubiquinone-9 3-methyltransferase (glyoxalase superfamily)